MTASPDAQEPRFTVVLTARELTEAARTLDDLYAWNEAGPSKLAAKLRAVLDAPGRDEAAELREATTEWAEAHRIVDRIGELRKGRTEAEYEEARDEARERADLADANLRRLVETEATQ